jgi:branched-chain amino acid transport system substrate-binding protein
MKGKAFFVGVYTLMVILLSACGQSQSERNAQATAIAAAIFSTQTASAPTATHMPSPTPQPTPTLTPTPICYDPLGCAEIPSHEQVKIGVALALEGGISLFGQEELSGVEMAIEDFGTFHGRAITLVVEDTGGCTSVGGERAARNLAEQRNLLGVIGTTCSASALPAAEILSNAGLVMVSPSNTAAALTDPETRQPGYFRVAPNDLWQALLVAQFAAEDRWRERLATVDDGSTYSKSLADATCDYFEDLGGTCVLQTSIEPGTTNMAQVLLDVEVYGADVLFFPIFPPEGIPLIEQAAEYPWREPILLISSDSMLDVTLSEKTNGAADGVYISMVPPAENADISNRYEAMYGEGPSTPFILNAYDATMLLLKAADQVAYEHGETLYIPRQALREAFYSFKDYPGLSGTLFCARNGDCGDDSQLAIAIVLPGQLVPVYPERATMPGMPGSTPSVQVPSSQVTPTLVPDDWVMFTVIGYPGEKKCVDLYEFEKRSVEYLMDQTGKYSFFYSTKNERYSDWPPGTELTYDFDSEPYTCILIGDQTPPGIYDVRYFVQIYKETSLFADESTSTYLTEGETFLRIIVLTR